MLKLLIFFNVCLLYHNMRCPILPMKVSHFASSACKKVVSGHTVFEMESLILCLIILFIHFLFHVVVRGLMFIEKVSCGAQTLGTFSKLFHSNFQKVSKFNNTHPIFSKLIYYNIGQVKHGQVS